MRKKQVGWKTENSGGEEVVFFSFYFVEYVFLPPSIPPHTLLGGRYFTAGHLRKAIDLCNFNPEKWVRDVCCMVSEVLVKYDSYSSVSTCMQVSLTVGT